jgi:GrpB-like predicted nucleotidyltransferase (UPF0157 family)
MIMSAHDSLITPYDPAWSTLFGQLSSRLRDAMGDRAIRIDHIGSTAVAHLDAKPIIDIQVSVESLEPLESYRRQIESCGFVWRSDNPELTKRYFREAPGARRTHLHVRRAGSFSEQFALLFRDYLRVHRTRADDYGRLKHELAPLLVTDRESYVRNKEPFIWATIQLADHWAQTVGWEPPPSDG